ncbi:hypothetical protein ACLKA7_005105 [Drosophila subpalustris]
MEFLNTIARVQVNRKQHSENIVRVAQKSKIGPSGGTPSCWNHYEKVHMILGGLRMHDVNTERLSTTNFVEVMNDPILFDPETSTCSTESSVSRSTEGSSAKRARIDTQAALIELAHYPGQ